MGDAQQIIKQFIRSYVKGRRHTVLAGQNDEEDCLLTLNRKLTVLSLEKGRTIPLLEVCQICVGLEQAEEQEVDLPIDDLCVTFLLNDGQDVAFRFADIEERDTFAICLGMFVDKLHQGRAPGEDIEGQSSADEEGDSRKIERSGSSRLSVDDALASFVAEMPDQAQQIVKQFAQGYLTGLQRTVLVGRDEEDCLLTLDTKLSALSLGNGRSISLLDVCQICVGLDAQDHEVDLPIDELCVTFLLSDERDVAFRFPDIEERDTFAICMGMFVDKLRNSAGNEEGDGQKLKRAVSNVSVAMNDSESKKAVVKTFVRSYVKGQPVFILSMNGGKTGCIATLDKEITMLSIKRPGKSNQRDIHLEKVERISTGTEAAEEVDLPLDENSVTLLLEDGQGIGFSFNNIEERDAFALCLKMFVKSRREAKKKAQRKGS